MRARDRQHLPQTPLLQTGELPEGYDHKYTYSHVGYNLKITDIQAACGLAQMAGSLSSSRRGSATLNT